MLFKIWGKGIVCNVYYIERETLDEISSAVSETGPGLKQLLVEHSDYIVNVSKGFFADSSLFQFECRLSNGETINRSFFEEKLAKVKEQDECFDEFEDDPRDFRISDSKARTTDITESQVAIIEYHEFEEGSASLDIPCDDKDKVTEMKLVCEFVDGVGPNGGVDLATKATYLEGIVGGEEYECSEAAIMGVEIDGKRYVLPEAKFETARSRVWLWVYDEDTEEHGLDFFGSQSLPDPWSVEPLNLGLGDIIDGFDQDPSLVRNVHDFFNQKSLDWIKENPDYVHKYLNAHTALKSVTSENPCTLSAPDFSLENVKLSTCELLCMFFDFFGVTGYDPVGLSQLNETQKAQLDFKTLSLGNETLLRSVQRSFCAHFKVMHAASSAGEETFQEMANPTLADAIAFVEEVLADPEALFNQKNP